MEKDFGLYVELCANWSRKRNHLHDSPLENGAGL